MLSNERLFLDLFAYRQRENKDPLEDWLTECLAATLRALPRPLLVEFFADLVGGEAREPTTAIASGRIDILTQYHVGKAGRPDMLIRLNGCPWIIFENKVAHGVATKKAADGSASDQLRGYAEWLHLGSGPIEMIGAI